MESVINFTNKQHRILWTGLGFLFILAIFLHRFSTYRWGVGVSHDSIFYISAAENLLEGNGISRIGGGNAVKPLTHFPPLYPISLSILGYFISVRNAANWWAAILLGINTALIALTIFRGSKSLVLGFLGGILALASPLILKTHFEAMSEPLYLALTLASLFLLASYLRYQQSWQLIFAAAAASLAYLTRYIGVSVLITGLLSIFWLFPGTFRTKLKKAALYGSISFIPNMIWYVRNYNLTGSLANRELIFHPITIEKLREGLQSISEWIFPIRASIWLGIGFLGLVALIAIVGFFLNPMKIKKPSGNLVIEKNPIHKLIVIHMVIYLALLFTSLTFFDISTRLDNRILFPVYVLFLIVCALGFQSLLRFSNVTLRKMIILISSVLFTIVAIVYVSNSLEVLIGMRQEGSGFNSATWRSSEIIAMLKKMDPGAIVYSNEAFPVYYLTDIGAYGIPEKFDPVKSEERDDYQSSMEVMRERLNVPNSALVVFHQGYLREGMPTLEEIVEDFVIAHESQDGVIFVFPENLIYWRND